MNKVNVSAKPYDHDAFISAKERDTDNKGRVDVHDLGDNWVLVVDYLDDEYGADIMGLPGKTDRYLRYEHQFYIDRLEGILYDGKGMATYYSDRNKGTKLLNLYESGHVHPDPALLERATADGFQDTAENWYEWDYSLMCEKMQIVGTLVLRDNLGTGRSYEQGEDRWFIPDADLTTPDEMIAQWERFEGYGHDWEYISLHVKLYFEGIKVAEDMLSGIECSLYYYNRENERWINSHIEDMTRNAVANLHEFTARRIDEISINVTPYNEREFIKQMERIAVLQVAREMSGCEILRRAGMNSLGLDYVDLWEASAS